MSETTQNTRILIVDDTLQNIQVLGTVLREQGYQLNVAQNGRQALDMAQKVLPDLILLDVMMPEMDGHETCEHLKADPATAEIPVIFLTAKVETDDIVKGFELGAVDYVTKPFNATELLRRVQTHLQLSLLQKDLESQVEAQTSQLLQAQKMESMGQLAAGIAHEVNTPMQYINNNTDFLQQVFEEFAEVMEKYHALYEQATKGAVEAAAISAVEAALEDGDIDYLREEAGKALAKTQDGVHRVVEIVQGMKELAHPGGREKAAADLNHTIETATTVCRNEWKYVADLQLYLEPSLPPIPCFAGEISQCIVNLTVNAAHAIQDATTEPDSRGVITIRTRLDGDAVEISIGDTGTGIAEDIQEKIFEFLFTTKEVGKGTGQGLALVQRVIRDNHGGSIGLESTLGEGTTFSLRLPLQEPCPASES